MMIVVNPTATVRALRAIPRSKQSSPAEHDELVRTFSALMSQTHASRDQINRLAKSREKARDQACTFDAALVRSLCVNFEGYLPQVVALGNFILQYKLKNPHDAIRPERMVSNESQFQAEFDHWQVLLRVLQNKTLDALDNMELSKPPLGSLRLLLLSTFLPHTMRVLVIASEYPQLVQTRTVETSAMSFMDLVRMIGSKGPSHKAAKLLSPQALGRLLVKCKDIPTLKHLLAVVHFLRPDKPQDWPLYFRQVQSFWDGSSFQVTLRCHKPLLAEHIRPGPGQLESPGTDALTERQMCLRIFEQLDSSEESFEEAALNLVKVFALLGQGQPACISVKMKERRADLWVQQRGALLALLTGENRMEVYWIEWANVTVLALGATLKFSSAPWEPWRGSNALIVEDLALTEPPQKVKRALFSFNFPRCLLKQSGRGTVGLKVTIRANRGPSISSSSSAALHSEEEAPPACNRDHGIRVPRTLENAGGEHGFTTLPGGDNDTHLHFFAEHENLLENPHEDLNDSFEHIGHSKACLTVANSVEIDSKENVSPTHKKVAETHASVTQASEVHQTLNFRSLESEKVVTVKLAPKPAHAPEPSRMTRTQARERMRAVKTHFDGSNSALAGNQPREDRHKSSRTPLNSEDLQKTQISAKQPSLKQQREDNTPCIPSELRGVDAPSNTLVKGATPTRPLKRRAKESWSPRVKQARAGLTPITHPASPKITRELGTVHKHTVVVPTTSRSRFQPADGQAVHPAVSPFVQPARLEDPPVVQPSLEVVTTPANTSALNDLSLEQNHSRLESTIKPSVLALPERKMIHSSLWAESKGEVDCPVTGRNTRAAAQKQCPVRCQDDCEQPDGTCFTDLHRSLTYVQESIYAHLVDKIRARQAASDRLLTQFQSSVEHEISRIKALVRNAHLAAQDLSRAGAQANAACANAHTPDAQPLLALCGMLEQWAIRERGAITTLNLATLE